MARPIERTAPASGATSRSGERDYNASRTRGGTPHARVQARPDAAAVRLALPRQLSQSPLVLTVDLIAEHDNPCARALPEVGGISPGVLPNERAGEERQLVQWSPPPNFPQAVGSAPSSSTTASGDIGHMFSAWLLLLSLRYVSALLSHEMNRCRNHTASRATTIHFTPRTQSSPVIPTEQRGQSPRGATSIYRCRNFPRYNRDLPARALAGR
jgi:hypothetical protein